MAHICPAYVLPMPCLCGAYDIRLSYRCLLPAYALPMRCLCPAYASGQALPGNLADSEVVHLEYDFWVPASTSFSELRARSGFGAVGRRFRTGFGRRSREVFAQVSRRFASMEHDLLTIRAARAQNVQPSTKKHLDWFINNL